MRANDIAPSGFTPESDSTSPGRSPPGHAAFQIHPATTTTTNGYPDANAVSSRGHWMHDNNNNNININNINNNNNINNSQSRSHAPRACEKCRLSKRKCDKKLPHCDRCLRLNARCHYLPDPITANVNPQGAAIVVYQPASLHDEVFRHVDPLVAITAPQILALISEPGSPAESEPDWRSSVNDFFTFVHPWYAVVHPHLFEQQIKDVLSSPAAAAHDPSPPVTGQPSPVSSSHDHPMSIKNAVFGYNHHHQASPPSEHHLKQLALLIVSMHLITQLRCTEAGCRPMFGAPYRTAKRLLALMLMGYTEPSQAATIELVQCGALMALYEYGHGEAPTAYRTLSETVAAANQLGIRPGSIDPGGEKNVPGLDLGSLSKMEKEQRSGLWWGLFILDQFIHKDEGTNHLPFLLEMPNPFTLLPETPPASATSQPQHPISVIVGTVQLSCFQLSAKIASLLHRALRIERERDPRPARMPPMSTFADLDHEVRRTSHTLLEQTIQWETMLDCFAMLVSALFTLYLPYLPLIESKAMMPAGAAEVVPGMVSDADLATALAALRFACKLSTDISCKVNPHIDRTLKSSSIGGTATSVVDDGNSAALAILAAPAGATCYAVIVAFAGFSRIFPGEREHCREAIAEKFESLRLFSFRWGIADRMIRQLGERHDINHSDYLKTPPPPSSMATRHSSASSSSM